MRRLSKAYISSLLLSYGGDIIRSPLFVRETEFLQHGSVTVYAHSISVAFFALYIVKKLHISLNERSLVRGALLHDYFLYDWHIYDKSHRLHGFIHASRAKENAERDFEINPLESYIIERHMFPLNIKPPLKKEAALVTIADKIIAFRETMTRCKQHNK